MHVCTHAHTADVVDGSSDGIWSHTYKSSSTRKKRGGGSSCARCSSTEAAFGTGLKEVNHSTNGVSSYSPGPGDGLFGAGGVGGFGAGLGVTAVPEMKSVLGVVDAAPALSYNEHAGVPSEAKTSKENAAQPVVDLHRLQQSPALLPDPVEMGLPLYWTPAVVGQGPTPRLPATSFDCRNNSATNTSTGSGRIDPATKTTREEPRRRRGRSGSGVGTLSILSRERWPASSSHPSTDTAARSAASKKISRNALAIVPTDYFECWTTIVST